MYRVNFNQGQVSQPFSTRKAADAYIADCKRDPSDPYSGLYFVQRRDADGFWMRCR